MQHVPTRRHSDFAWTVSNSDVQTAAPDPEYLRTRTSWIRDDLDPLIAREGPDTLSSDAVITLFTFFDELRKSNIPLHILRYSRIHLALLDISGRATRWPGKLIDQVDDLVKHWESIYGSLLDIRPFLYEEGGRLHGISTPEDIDRARLLIKWLRAPATPVSPAISRRHGGLGFKAGECVARLFYLSRFTDNSIAGGLMPCLPIVPASSIMASPPVVSPVMPTEPTLCSWLSTMRYPARRQTPLYTDRRVPTLVGIA